MADIKITFSDGEEVTYQNAPESLTPDDVISRVNKDYAGKQIKSVDRKSYADMGAGQVALEAVKNIVPSTANLLGNVISAIASPVQTAGTLAAIPVGAMARLFPEMEKSFQPGSIDVAKQIAGAVGEQYKERYGSAEGLKKAIATDPAGVASDLSAILGVGAVAAPGRAGQVLKTAADVTNPVNLAIKGAGKVMDVAGKAIPATLGLSTGAGEEAIKQAYQAGKAGGKTGEMFKENLRGKADITSVIDSAKSNLEEFAKQRRDLYQSNMAGIKSDASILSFDGIDNALSRAFDKVSYKGVIKNQAAADKLQQVSDDIAQWKALDPANFHTPEGLDALKQRIGDILETIPFESKTARSAIGDVYNSIKKEIGKQAPTYEKTMRAYSEASDTIKEIERALSLNKKASVDTQLRKLQSIMRNNVNTNYGQREKLVQLLENVGGQPIRPALAGQALSAIAPRGIQRATAIPETLMAGSMFGLPGALTSMAASSPRLVGEAAYGAGKTARGLLDLTNKAPKIDYATYLNLLAQTR